MIPPEDVAAVAEFIATVSVLSKNCADIVHWSMEADALRAVARELERLYALEAEHETLRADATRLEWLEEILRLEEATDSEHEAGFWLHYFGERCEGEYHGFSVDTYEPVESTLRTAIDAARREQEGEG